MITASKINLARSCEGAFAVEQIAERNQYQDAGEGLHSEREDAINAGNPPAVLTDRWPGYTWRAEVKFAINIATGVGRELTAPGKRNYSEADALDVCGTADVLGIPTDTTKPLVVVDWKSFDPNVPRAHVNAQLHIAALAFCRALGYAGADVAIVHEVRPLDVAELDELDLDAFHAELRSIMERAAAARQRHRDGQPVDFTTGSHCRWCDGFHACPKQKSLALAVRDGSVDKRVEMIVPLGDDESAADAYEFSQQLGMLKKRLDSALYARAKERPFLLRNGKMFGQVEKLGNEKLDGDVVYEVVKAKHGQSIADAAVVRSATKTRLRDALGFVGAKSVAAAEKEILDEVRAKGGAKREKKVEIDEYAPQLKAGGQ